MSAELPLSIGDAEPPAHAHPHHAPALARRADALPASPFAWSALQRLGLVALLLVALWAAILWAMA